MPRPKKRAGWLLRWRRSLEVIQGRVNGLWIDREYYRAWRAVIDANDGLDKTNGFLWLFEQAYWNSLLIGIRSIDDRDIRSHSLFRVICEVSENKQLLTKKWFVDRFRSKTARIRFKMAKMGELQFKRDWSGWRTISKQRVCKDAAVLTRACKRVRMVVNGLLAHNSRNPPRNMPKRREVDSALDTLFVLLDRYSALIENKSWSHPVPLMDLRIFDIPWRKATVVQAMQS